MASPSSWFFLSLLLLTAGCAGGGGGGGSGGPPVDPPTAPTAFTPLAGLESVVPGPGALRIEFTPPAEAGFEVAAFVSTSRANLFGTAPRVPAGGATSVTVGSLANGVQHFIGLGIRPTGGGSYQQTGPSLTATPGAPIYVDAASTANPADGLTPATAFPDLFTAVLTAFAAVNGNPASSANVWVKGGTYAITSTLPVTAGVNIYGGFGAAFDLATRDRIANPTIWSVAAGQIGLTYGDQVNTNLSVIVDGVRITGNGTASIAIDTDGTDPCHLELRSLVATDFADRGMRIRNSNLTSFDVTLIACQSSRNGSDGFNGNGPFDYSFYNCIFAQNANEGLDVVLVPETAGLAQLTVTSSQFFGNGFGTGAQALSEGLDCAMGLPLAPTSGAYEVTIRASSFERNALAGCAVDADFEQFNGYSGDVVVRECSARANGTAGFSLDLDGPLDATQELRAFVHGVCATSNGTDGILAGSESRAGLLGISTSALIGNIGAGLRIEGPVGSAGNRTVFVSHCLLAANGAGGMLSRDIPATASSSIAYQQASAFDANTVQVGDVSTSDPALIAFASAPEEYARVIARAGAVLTLAAAPAFPLSARLELADDGSERLASTLSGTQVTLVEEPDDFRVPGLLAAFAPGAGGVDEDYSLLGGSIALAAGLNGADAGPSGSSAPARPGVASPIPAALFYPVAASPALATVVGNATPVVLTFSKALNGATVNGTTVRARRNGNTLSISLQTSGATLTVNPPGAGWGTGDFRIELDGVRASDGTELSGAVVLPVQR